MLGEKIINGINALKNRGLTVEHKKTVEGNEYVLIGERYRFAVTVNPQRWLGLEFDLIDRDNESLLNYAIDTDLYPISQSKYYHAALAIEDEIVEFINSLANNQVKIGEIKGKPAMIIPKANEFLLIKKGWFFISTKQYKNLKDAELDGVFKERL